MADSHTLHSLGDEQSIIFIIYQNRPALPPVAAGPGAAHGLGMAQPGCCHHPARHCHQVRPSSVTRPRSAAQRGSVTRPGSVTGPSSVTGPGHATGPSSAVVRCRPGSGPQGSATGLALLAGTRQRGMETRCETSRAGGTRQHSTAARTRGLFRVVCGLFVFSFLMKRRRNNINES